ncbi:MAG: SAM-dependent methyltransferase, partial [Hyphomicrobiaceae bacterium]
MTTYLALVVISAATLAYEVLLVRLFAIIQWHHFAFMAISIALLGFGASGTLLALSQDWVKSRFTEIFAASSALFGVFAPASFILAQSLPFNALMVVWEPGQLLYLPILYLLLTLPFFLAATCIGLAFVCFGDSIGRVYAYNLMGSAVGALGVIATLIVSEPSVNLRLIAALGFVSAALVVLDQRLTRWRALSGGAAALGFVVLVILPDAWFGLRISPYKGLPQALKVSEAKVLSERSGPLGLLTVVESRKVPFRYMPGLSLNAPAVPPRQLGVFIDGGSMTTINHYDGRRKQLAFLDYSTDALVYHLIQRPTVLVLGAGGGRSVLQALYHNAQRIDAVELDPNMVSLVRQDYANMAGHIYSRPEVHIHVDEARGFVTSSQDRWDVLQIPLLDAAGAGAAGVHGLSETYIYTVEALEGYLRHIRPGGWLSITRWLKIPPRDALKLFATALDALHRLGIEAPEKSLVLLRGINTTTLLVKRGAVTQSEIARVRAFSQERSFD